MSWKNTHRNNSSKTLINHVDFLEGSGPDWLVGGV